MLFRALAGCALAWGLAVTAAASELKLGYSLPPASHYGVAAAAMAEDLARRTGGKWTIKPYPAGSLGGEREMIEGAQIGTLDIVIASSGAAGHVVPDTLVTDIPFLFRDLRHARAVLDGPIGRRILDQFPKHGLVALAWGENGFRSLTNSRRPVRTPEDARGLKVRTMENPVHRAAFKALGLVPTPMAFPELFSALQQGDLDGQENPIGVILAAKLPQVQKYLSLTEHAYSAALVILSPSIWMQLDGEEKRAFREAALVGAQAMRRKAAEEAETGVEELKRQGMEVAADIDRKAFEDALKPAYADYARKFGQDRIDEIRAYRY